MCLGKRKIPGSVSALHCNQPMNIKNIVEKVSMSYSSTKVKMNEIKYHHTGGLIIHRMKKQPDNRELGTKAYFQKLKV